MKDRHIIVVVVLAVMRPMVRHGGAPQGNIWVEEHRVASGEGNPSRHYSPPKQVPPQSAMAYVCTSLLDG